MKETTKYLKKINQAADKEEVSIFMVAIPKREGNKVLSGVTITKGDFKSLVVATVNAMAENENVMEYIHRVMMLYSERFKKAAQEMEEMEKKIDRDAEETAMQLKSKIDAKLKEGGGL